MENEKKINRDEKFKNLFERTADEIFYDFLKKHKTKLLGLLSFIMLFVVAMTINYVKNEKLNQDISNSIHEIIQQVKMGKNCNSLIDKLLPKTQTSKIVRIFNLDKKKLSYRAVLLLLKNQNTLDLKEFKIYLKDIEELPYVCQYISTIEHFKRFSFVSELLFFKTIQDMQNRGYQEKDILNFFMKKKLHASIFKGHMYTYIGIVNKNSYILSDLISSFDVLDTVSVQKIPKIFLSLIDIECKHNKSKGNK